MSDAGFRRLFALLEQPVDPRPEFVEGLLRDIDGIAAPAATTTPEPAAEAGAASAQEGWDRERSYLVGPDHPRVPASVRRLPRRRVVGALVAAAAVLALIVASVVTRPDAHHQAKGTATVPTPSGPPHLYWADWTGIGRANLDGSGVVRQLIPLTGIDSAPCGIAVEGNYVYWSTPLGTLARARRDGAGLDMTLVVTDPVRAYCMAANAGHLYWSNSEATIARANLDGTSVQDFLISGTYAYPCGIAVDSAHVYWANTLTGTIGRANVDGTGVNADFITGAGAPLPGGTSSANADYLPSTGNPLPSGAACGVVVDGAHIYWGRTDGTIGRANLDGTGVNTRFITGLATPGSYPLVCADDGTHLYWANASQGRSSSSGIGRARLDGTHVEQDFISGVTNPSGCAVAP